MILTPDAKTSNFFMWSSLLIKLSSGRDFRKTLVCPFLYWNVAIAYCTWYFLVCQLEKGACCNEISPKMVMKHWDGYFSICYFSLFPVNLSFWEVFTGLPSSVSIQLPNLLSKVFCPCQYACAAHLYLTSSVFSWHLSALHTRDLIL